MSRTDSDRTASRRPTRSERAFVLAGAALAAVVTAASLALDISTAPVGAFWFAAIAWTVLASLACAVRRGVRDRDWSAFRRAELQDNRDDRIDWVSKTGTYSWLRAEEDEALMDDSHLR